MQLRRTIDCLPVATRRAMLTGLQAGERIIAGAYVDGQGGICPMLAAHRHGGRTNFLSFARAWDRFTRTGRAAREASSRELAILTGQLEASLMSDSADLALAISEHKKLARRSVSEQADPRGEIAARRLRRRARPDLSTQRHPPGHEPARRAGLAAS